MHISIEYMYVYMCGDEHINIGMCGHRWHIYMYVCMYMGMSISI